MVECDCDILYFVVYLIVIMYFSHSSYIYYLEFFCNEEMFLLFYVPICSICISKDSWVFILFYGLSNTIIIYFVAQIDNSFDLWELYQPGSCVLLICPILLWAFPYFLIQDGSGSPYIFFALVPESIFSPSSPGSFSCWMMFRN